MNTHNANNPYIELGKGHGTSNVALKQHRQLLAAYCAIFFLSLAIVALVASNVYFAVFKQPRDYILEVDGLNRVTYGGALDAQLHDIDLYMPNEIIRFIENWRTVTGDNTMQKIAANRLYCMLIPESAASTRMNEYYKNPTNNPFEINRDRTRTINMRNILQQSEKTWHVEFLETTRNHTGAILGEAARFKAQMVISRSRPRDSCMETNPLGIYVTDINWSSVL